MTRTNDLGRPTGYHWGTYPSTAQLPNVAGSSTQTDQVDKGDLAAILGTVYRCTLHTPGAATWAALSTQGTAYGELYVESDNATPATVEVTTAGTWYLVDAADTAGEASGVTATIGTGRLTVASSGVYRAAIHSTCNGTLDAYFTLAFFVDGTRVRSVAGFLTQNSGELTQGNTGGVVGSALLSLSAGSYVDVRVTSDTNSTEAAFIAHTFSLEAV